MNKNDLHRLALLTLLLAGCSSPPKEVPKVSTSAPGSAPGPVYGQPLPAGTQPSPQMDHAERELSQSLRGSQVTVNRTTDGRLWLTLPGDLSFEPNRSALKPGARAVLDKLVVALRNLPSAELRIVGHTDAKGAGDGNDALSLDRAASTRDWLVARGLLASRISVAGRGARDPLASNDNDAGRAANRRVEILIADRVKASAKAASQAAAQPL